MRRFAVGHLRERFNCSERGICRALRVWRATMRYRTQRGVAPELIVDLRQVSMERPRFGYRRLHVMLKRKGWTVNKKLVLRLVRENGAMETDEVVSRRRDQRRQLAQQLGRGEQRRQGGISVLVSG